MTERTKKMDDSEYGKAMQEGSGKQPKISLEQMLSKADADPLALNAPTPEDMRESVSRAKIASHIVVEDMVDGPELTKDESALLDRLSKQHVAIALRRLLLTDPQQPWSEIAAFPEVGLKWSRITDRVIDMASVFCAARQGDRYMREVAEFFGDGRPFTCSRYEAMMEARRLYPGCRTRQLLPQNL